MKANKSIPLEVSHDGGSSFKILNCVAYVIAEKKKPTNITLRPSIVKAAKKKAKKQKTSLSQIVENKLSEYIS